MLAAPHADQVRVWDLFVRLFHWSNATLFAAAYLTGEFKANEIHVLAGYAIGILLVMRLVWGVVGTPYARFASFTFGPAETLRYARASMRGHPPHYLGHNPLGALMVFLLLAMLAGIVVTGLIIDGAIEFEGPLLGITGSMTDAQAYAVKRLHETLATITLGLVVLHVLGALVAGILHRENLIRSMFTGLKNHPAQPGPRPDQERS